MSVIIFAELLQTHKNNTDFCVYLLSHPARGAWIEIVIVLGNRGSSTSHPARGAWIEISLDRALVGDFEKSHPARGAWIEISHAQWKPLLVSVAPRTGCVD